MIAVAVKPIYLIAAAAVAAVVFFAQLAVIYDLRADVAGRDARIAELKAEHSEAVAKAARDSLERERALQDRVNIVRGEANEAIRKADELASQVVSLTADRDRLRRINGGLRNKIDAFAAGGADTAAACRDRAARLGAALARGHELLTEGVEVVGECVDLLGRVGRDADVRGVKAAALHAGWPPPAGAPQP